MATAPRPNTDFDFFMGTWERRHRYLVKRLTDCRDWIESDGSCAARKILGGFGNIDENDIDLPGDDYRGMSLRNRRAAAGTDGPADCRASRSTSGSNRGPRCEAFSPDGDNDWETNWYMDFTRV